MRVVTRVISVVLTPLVTFVPLAAQTSPVTAATDSQASALRVKVIDRDPVEIAVGSQAQRGYTVLVTDSSGNPVADAAVACRLPDGNPTGTFAQGAHSTVVFTGIDGRAHVSQIQWGTTAGTVVIRITANKGEAHAGMLVDQTLAPAIAASKLVPASRPPAVSAPPLVSEPPAVSVVNLQPKKSRPLARHEAPSEDPVVLARQQQPAIAAPDQEPEVTVTGAPAGEKVARSSKKKWIILAIVAGAGAAAAAGFVARGKSSSSSNSSSSMSVGSPSISVGQP